MERSRIAWILAAACLALAFVGSHASSQSGFTAALRISRSAYPVPDAAPNVIVHRPPSFDASRPYDIVVALHGWSTCINVFVRPGRVSCTARDRAENGWGVADRFDATGRNAILIVPQIAYRSHVGHAGNFEREGFARAVVDEALAAVHAEVPNVSSEGAARVLAVAHSAGFETAFAMSRRSGFGPKLRRVALMDGLYDVPEFFGRWARDDASRSLVSLHIGGRPEQNAARLGTYVRRALPASSVAINPAEVDLAAAVASHRVVIARVRGTHTQALLNYLDDVIGP